MKQKARPMKSIKRLIYLVILIYPLMLNAQVSHEYGPSQHYPFGRPNPKAPAQITDYAPMIGVCDCSSVSRKPDQTWADPVQMTWTFKYIMNGMAVQDETIKADGGHSGSIRQYIADSARWFVHYYSSPGATPVLPAWEGNRNEKENQIVLFKDSPAPNGMAGDYRLTFSEMTEDGFKWVGEWVDKSRSVVFPTWRIECKKRKLP